jgi:hypothetical protein
MQHPLAADGWLYGETCSLTANPQKNSRDQINTSRNAGLPFHHAMTVSGGQRTSPCAQSRFAPVTILITVQ